MTVQVNEGLCQLLENSPIQLVNADLQTTAWRFLARCHDFDLDSDQLWQLRALT